jgi:hypothetical protein
LFFFGGWEEGEGVLRGGGIGYLGVEEMKVGKRERGVHSREI